MCSKKVSRFLDAFLLLTYFLKEDVSKGDFIQKGNAMLYDGLKKKLLFKWE